MLHLPSCVDCVRTPMRFANYAIFLQRVEYDKPSDWSFTSEFRSLRTVCHYFQYGRTLEPDCQAGYSS